MKIKVLEKKHLPALVDLHYEVLPNEFLTSISKSFLLDFYTNLFESKNTIFLGIFKERKENSEGYKIFADQPANNAKNLRAVKDTKFSQKTLSWRRILYGQIKTSSPTNVFKKIFCIQTAQTQEKNFITDLSKNKKQNHQGLSMKSDYLIGAIIEIEKNYHPNIRTYFLTFLSIIKNFWHFSSPKKLNYLYQSLIFKIKSDQETEIFFIGIDKKYQNKGLGKKLILELEKKLKKRYSTLCVDCKEKLPSNFFYKKLGFKLTKTFTLYGENWNRYKKKI